MLLLHGCRKPTKDLVDAGLVMLDMQATQVGALFEDVIWSFVQASSGKDWILGIPQLIMGAHEMQLPVVYDLCGSGHVHQ